MFYGFIHTVPQPGPFACQAQAMHVLVLDESRTARAAVPSPAHLAGLLSSRCWLGRPLRQVDDGGTWLLLPQGIDAHSDLGNWALVARAMAVGRGVYPSELPL